MASGADATTCPRWKRLFRIGLALATIDHLRRKVALLRRARAAALLQASGVTPAPFGSVAAPVAAAMAREDRVRLEVIRLLDQRIAVLHRKLDRRLTRGEAAQARSVERDRLQAGVVPPAPVQTAAAALPRG